MTTPSPVIPVDSETRRPGLETPLAVAVRRFQGASGHEGRLAAVEIFVSILTVLVISLVAFQIHFTLPVVGFVLFLVIVVAAIRLGFWQATVTSLVAVGCLDFFFTQPLYSLKTDPAGLTALAAFESAALVVSRLSAQVQLQARIASQQSMNMERLYELARNILLVNRHEPQGPQIARYVQQAIGVESVALFDSSTLQVSMAGEPEPVLEEFARKAWLTDKGEDDPEGLLWSRVLRVGYKGTGAIAMQADHLSPIVADAVASIAAIALERSRSLEKETRAEAAKQSEQLRTAVLDALAHAFKTPLTTILAASSGLLDGETLSAQETELVTLIDDQAVVLNDLTTRLLQTARLEGAEMHLRREEISIGELIDEVIEPFSAHLKQRPPRMEIADRDIPVSVDTHLMVMALRQLIDNALKYSDPGSAITISAAETPGTGNGEVVIAVQNEGPAIRPEDRERIFERFYRSPGTEHRAPGTGLGLSITKKIAEAHLGRVWVGSGEKGATFYFALPFDRSIPRGSERRPVEDDPGA